jgi:hypothetical protein
MRKHGDKLTNACVAALVKNGDVLENEMNSAANAQSHQG